MAACGICGDEIVAAAGTEIEVFIIRPTEENSGVNLVLVNHRHCAEGVIAEMESERRAEQAMSDYANGYREGIWDPEDEYERWLESC